MQPQSDRQSSGFIAWLTIANRTDELHRVMAWLEQVAENFHLPERTVFKLDVVLNEAIPNIIGYAYPDRLSHDIIIKLENRDDLIMLEIIDDGIAFNPLTKESVKRSLSLQSAPIGGRGIQLIKSFSDAQEYQRLDNTNRMRVHIFKSDTNQPAAVALA